jgi:hypothetical protein
MQGEGRGEEGGEMSRGIDSHGTDEGTVVGIRDLELEDSCEKLKAAILPELGELVVAHGCYGLLEKDGKYGMVFLSLTYEELYSIPAARNSHDYFGSAMKISEPREFGEYGYMHWWPRSGMLIAACRRRIESFTSTNAGAMEWMTFLMMCVKELE